ncbi:DcrB-related protein [Morganella morganii]|uniref:DcrB-related protein n=1 Tax=Morganella morganii TaxID=582 RepID=UPI00164C17F4|nr:DcrB-related protein [Morganella morganii]MBC4011863.1 DcrB-related protein [Morganella morganii]MCF1264320.1 DcrB-related protein [Morganella morganii]
MSKNNEYIIPEGSFITSTPDLDNTINILIYRDPTLNEYNIIIHRAFLDQDETVEEFCENEVTNFTRDLPGFREEGKMITHELGPMKMKVVQIANSYLKEGERLQQVQSLIKLPYHKDTNPNNNRLIIFTLSRTGEFTEYQRKHYVRVLNSFTPNSTFGLLG